MKRPKIADMNRTELAQWTALKARRSAKRSLEIYRCIRNPSEFEDGGASMEAHIAAAKTIIALTKPSRIRAASADEIIPILDHIEVCLDRALGSSGSAAH
jgi:hypothetical protein